MGNTESSSSKGERKRGSKRRNKQGDAQDVASRAKQVVGESVQNLQANIQTQIKQLEEQDHPAAHFLDSVCGAYMDDRDVRRGRSSSFYSEDYGSEEEDDDRTYSEDETTTTTEINSKRGRGRESRRRDEPSVGGDTASYLESDYESQKNNKKAGAGSTSFESEDSYSKNDASEKSTTMSVGTEDVSKLGAAAAGGAAALPKPLASSFAKRCYFTKAGIGSSAQHYEGLTLTGNVVLMLAQAMKLKGCPTICDEDLRRVEQTYPNQFSRLPDELLLSSGWRRISKYCHFSHKPIPDGIPFFHSKQRLHPSGGYYFLLAAAVGMVRPIDVEPLTRDTLVLLETDFPTDCDVAPKILIEDPDQWTLVDKFCFFSGGPINTDEDVYYQADFDGNPIFMLAFLSPSLTPSELYKLDPGAPDGTEPGLKTVMAVQEVESVYDLTDRDFDDLRLYHLGPCRALPQYILQPSAWAKVLPPHFLQARDTAMQRAEEFEMVTHGAVGIHGLASSSSSPNKIPQHNLSVGAMRQIPVAGSFTQGQPQPGLDPGMMDAAHQQPMMHQHLHPQQLMQYMPQDGMHMQLQMGMDSLPLQQQMGIEMQQPIDMELQQQMGIPQQMIAHPQNMMGMPPMAVDTGMQQQQHFHPEQQFAMAQTPQEDQMVPMDEAAESPPRSRGNDPPDDEPPSLSKGLNSMEDAPFYGAVPQQPLNGFGFADQQMQMHGYEVMNDQSAPAPMPDYGQEQQFMPDEQRIHHQPEFQPDDHNMQHQVHDMYPGAPRQPQFQEGELNTQMQHQVEQRHPSVQRERPHKLQDEEQNIHANQIPPEQIFPDQRDTNFQEEAHNMQVPQPEQRFPSAQRQRLHNDEHHMQMQQSTEQRYPSIQRQRSHNYHDDEQNIQQPLEQRHPSVQRQRSHNLQEEEQLLQEQKIPYHQEAGQDGYYGAEEKLREAEDYGQQPNSPFSGDEPITYFSESKEDTSPANEEPISPQETLKFEYSADPSEERRTEVSAVSPTSQSQANTPSEYSHTSSAMRGARELLKRNRQKRLELAARKSQDHSENTASSPKDLPSPNSEVSGATWESGSEVTSVVSAASSAWTENSGAPERSSRRALILQMAKARMKNNKGSGASVGGDPSSPTDFGNPEIRGTYSITEEEKKLDSPLDDGATDIDIAGDLD